MARRRSCVSWYHLRDFTEEFPEHEAIADQLFLVDGDRITCSGGSGVADLAAFLIARHIGGAAAQKSLHVLQLERARDGWSAQPHPPIGHQIADERVRRALLLMEQAITDPLPIARIAASLRISLRQLDRLFHEVLGIGPGAAYRRLRLRYARLLLETTSQTVTEVAVESGFADCAHFTRQFKELFGVTPSRARGATLLAPPAARRWNEPADRTDDARAGDRRAFG
jgi:transcriptional regulator GlxA family with amidase domain